MPRLVKYLKGLQDTWSLRHILAGQWYLFLNCAGVRGGRGSNNMSIVEVKKRLLEIKGQRFPAMNQKVGIVRTYEEMTRES